RILDGETPGLRRFNGIGRADQTQVRDRPERHQVLDRLMRGAVLTETDRIVGEDIDYRHLHQGAEAYGRSHVVAENQERSAVRAQSSMEGDAVAGRGHRMLTHAEAQISPVRRVLLEVLATFDVRLVRWSQICGSTKEERHLLCDGIEHF